eukprot:403363099
MIPNKIKQLKTNTYNTTMKSDYKNVQLLSNDTRKDSYQCELAQSKLHAQDMQQRMNPFNLEKELKNRQILLKKSKLEVHDTSTYKDNFFYKTSATTNSGLNIYQSQTPKYNSGNLNKITRNSSSLQQFHTSSSSKTQLIESQILQKLNIKPEELTKLKANILRESSHRERFQNSSEAIQNDRLVQKNPQYPCYQLPFRGKSQYQNQYPMNLDQQTQNSKKLRVHQSSKDQLKIIEQLIMGKSSSPTFFSDHFQSLNQKGWQTERMRPNLSQKNDLIKAQIPDKNIKIQTTQFIKNQNELSYPTISQLPNKLIPRQHFDSTQRLDFQNQTKGQCMKKTDIQAIMDFQ